MPYLQRRFLKAANRPNRLITGFEIMPFLGVAFVLLCIFMTNGSPLHGFFPVGLAKSSFARKLPFANREDAIRIFVTRDGSIYFRANKIALDVLPNRIHDSVLSGAEKRVYVLADARARYGEVEEVIDQVSLSGVRNLSFITR
jgi:biopolymer transport protein TolR